LSAEELLDVSQPAVLEFSRAEVLETHGLDELQGVLDQLVQRVIGLTPFQRAVASLYAEPLAPVPHAEARVVTFSSWGLNPEEKRKLQLFVDRGGTVRGVKFSPEFRLGNSYYIPGGRVPAGLYPLIPSRRRFVAPDGWRAEDLLLVPLRVRGQIIGQLSVDDPADGARPTPIRLRGLEDLATMAALALRKAHVLEVLQERYQVFHFLAERAITGLVVVQEGRVRYANAQAARLLGYSRQELLNMTPWWQIFHPSERVRFSSEGLLVGRQFETRALRGDGGIVWLKVQVHALDYQGKPALSVQLVDISDRVQTEALLKERAIRDPLTGLFNRYYFEETVLTELRRSQRYKRPFTILMADLAGFKQVNDRLGHQEGDRVLREVAQLIRAQVRQSDWVVRYGGDEFLVVLPETGPSVEALVQRLKRAVEDWARENLPDIPLGVDVGWATWTPEENPPITSLLQEADAHMYEGKRGREAV